MSATAAWRPRGGHHRFTCSRAISVATDLQSSSITRWRRIVRLCGVHACRDLGRSDVAWRYLVVERVAFLRLHQHATSPVDGVRRRRRCRRSAATASTAVATSPGQFVRGRRQSPADTAGLVREALLLSERIAPIAPSRGRRAGRPVRRSRDGHLACISEMFARVTLMMLMMVNRRRRSAEFAEVRQLAPPRHNSVRDEVAVVAVVVVSADRRSVSTAACVSRVH